MIGTVVGHYRVTARLSAGGMGIVYRAEHTLLGKPAAIKILHPELSTNRDIVNRFFNEAKATTSIRHVGIVEVFDFGYLESGHAYLVMELLDGEPLSAAIRRSRFGQTAAVVILRGVCSALAAAHAKGIVHRDLKPDNIFLVPDPDAPFGARPKLLDFGIAKLTDVSLEASATRTGAVMGTPTYMSPEQCRGTGEVDHRADLYSLGCVLYEMLCGRPPFTSQGAGELIGAHQYVTPESPRVHVPELAPALERLVLGLLAKNPADRPQSASEVAQRFDELARSGLLSGISYELATSGAGLPGAPAMTPVPPMSSMPGGRPSAPKLTPATHPLRPHDAPTLATPYSLEVLSASGGLAGPGGALGMGPTTLSGATGATGHGAQPRGSRGWKIAAGVIAAGALAVAAAVLVPRAAGGGQPVEPAAAPARPSAGSATGPTAPPEVEAGSAAAPPGAGAAGAQGSAQTAPPPAPPVPSEAGAADGSATAEAGAGSAVAPPPEPGAGSKSEPADPGAGSGSAASSGATKPKDKGGRRGAGKGKGKAKDKVEGDVPTLIEDDI